MSDQWNPSMVPDGSIPEETERINLADGPDAVPADEPTGDPIVLPPAGSDVGASLAATSSGEPTPSEPVTVVQGPPTPPAGTWTPYPGNPWAGPYGNPGAGGAGMPPGGAWPAAWYPYQAPPPTPPRKPARKGLVAGMAAVVLAAAVLAGAGLGQLVWPSNTTATATSAGGSTGSNGSGGYTDPFGGSGTSGSGSSGSESGSASGAPSDVSSIAAKVDPGLVDINTNLSYENEQAAGTGQVLTSTGEVLTNNHVIDGATSISVTDIGNGKTYSASVVGYDRTQDVAVIQLKDASGLTTVTTSSTAAQTGQAVVGIGNAGGTGGTPSTAGGSVTALNQAITASDDSGGNSEHLTGLIETDAPIQAGDSGGPLVNTDGEVLGMDTAASASSFSTSSGTTAYAIPIATALRLAKQIEAGNSSSTVHIGQTAFLGVSVSASNSSSSTGSGSDGGFGSGFGGQFGNGFGGDSGDSGNTGSGTGSSTTGATVEGTVATGPAAAAGITEGDVITSVAGTTVTSSTDLSNILSRYHPGNTVTVQWTDTSGTTQSASLKLAVGPAA